jgi:MFS family permease
VYGAGALVVALSQVLLGLIAGYSLGEGIGTAVLIPPVYILATVYFDTVQSRAKALAAISGAGAWDPIAGPLIRGPINSAANWRVAFGVQTLLAVVIQHVADASSITRWKVRNLNST